jgi:hypothetical protein
MRPPASDLVGIGSGCFQCRYFLIVGCQQVLACDNIVSIVVLLLQSKSLFRYTTDGDDATRF